MNILNTTITPGVTRCVECTFPLQLGDLIVMVHWPVHKNSYFPCHADCMPDVSGMTKLTEPAPTEPAPAPITPIPRVVNKPRRRHRCRCLVPTQFLRESIDDLVDRMDTMNTVNDYLQNRMDVMRENLQTIMQLLQDRAQNPTKPTEPIKG